MVEEQMITLTVSKFKRILLFGWHLLSQEQQLELARMGIHPERTVIRK
ncbi:hypothetical protein JW711_00495 [Candidatus Woesearchaeota archaeon]|nr:hypothetical protein [Candidatus Woesearchaeota archaeon]